MAQAVVTLSEYEDRVISIVKGMYGLKSKSDAVSLVIERFGQDILEPQISPEYRKELEKISKGKFKAFSCIGDLRKEIEHV